MRAASVALEARRERELRETTTKDDRELHLGRDRTRTPERNIRTPERSRTPGGGTGTGTGAAAAGARSAKGGGDGGRKGSPPHTPLRKLPSAHKRRDDKSHATDVDLHAIEQPEVLSWVEEGVWQELLQLSTVWPPLSKVVVVVLVSVV